MLEVNSHIAHSTATFLELSIAFSALSLRALNSINHTCGDADKTTLDVLRRRDEEIDGAVKVIKNHSGFWSNFRSIFKLCFSMISMPPRRSLTVLAKAIFFCAVILLCLLGLLHFENSDFIFFVLASLLCLIAAYVAYRSDSTKIQAEISEAGKFTNKFMGHHKTSENSED